MSRHFIPTLLSVRMEGRRWLTSVATPLLPCVFRLVKTRLLLLTSDLSAVFCCFCGFLAAPVRPPSFSNLIFYSFSNLSPSFPPSVLSPLLSSYTSTLFGLSFPFLSPDSFIFLFSFIQQELFLVSSCGSFIFSPSSPFIHLFFVCFLPFIPPSFLSSLHHFFHPSIHSVYFVLLIISCFLSSFLAVILLFSPSSCVCPHILSSSLLRRSFDYFITSSSFPFLFFITASLSFYFFPLITRNLPFLTSLHLYPIIFPSSSSFFSLTFLISLSLPLFLFPLLFSFLPRSLLFFYTFFHCISITLHPQCSHRDQ